MSMFTKEVTAVALGGAFGSVMRLLLSRWIEMIIPYAALPWGIIAVNIVGCFFIGVVYGVVELKLLLNPLWRSGLIIGVLGGFTTFSSFSVDTFAFLQKGELSLAIFNIVISVIVCLLATFLGYSAIRFVL
ncbi:MAG: hypothetical protein A3E82_00920 [Gammaproteobacteria bacterium RIFCSPHIGHO2_12_FULL_38_11]|nr:MAG: hypothetical protein A3E82_00920 [Gammaproteobacteria bacterium RIFCSPHIGHO2_12_FULL_38_11]